MLSSVDRTHIYTQTCSHTFLQTQMLSPSLTNMACPMIMQYSQESTVYKGFVCLKCHVNSWLCVSFVLNTMATNAMQPHLLYIYKETQKPPACVLVMPALVLIVFSDGSHAQGVSCFSSQASCTNSLSLSFFSLFDTLTVKLIDMLYMYVHTSWSQLLW